MCVFVGICFVFQKVSTRLRPPGRRAGW
eukprot:COSAG05_NODE_20035_length_284_cov_0.572973_1_plen_27_part_01